MEELNGVKYEATLEQSYSFIELELKDSANQLFLNISYKIEHPGTLILSGLYCSDNKLVRKLKLKANQLLGEFKWDSVPKTTFDLGEKQIEYLQIADRIAAFGNDLSATPTDFRNVVVTSNFIKLDQSNYWNSRSLDHKDSYLLRDLYFYVPLNDAAIKVKNDKLVFGSYFIGDMVVIFSNGSADSQKEIGNEI